MSGDRDLWGELDKLGRWRSRRWRAWVRGLGCSCAESWCRNCGLLVRGPREAIHAAHLRGPATGIGAKPDDFLCYPLAASTHGRFHARGQPARAWQLARVSAVWVAAFDWGILRPSPSAEELRGVFSRACEGYTDHGLELATLEARAAITAGDLEVGEPRAGLVIF